MPHLCFVLSVIAQFCIFCSKTNSLFVNVRHVTRFMYIRVQSVLYLLIRKKDKKHTYFLSSEPIFNIIVFFF